jgi:hypothetical protein
LHPLVVGENWHRRMPDLTSATSTNLLLGLMRCTP